MTYADKNDMIAAYDEQDLIQLTDRAIPSAGVIDDAVLQQQLEGVTSLIDSYVSARYTVPVSPVPVVLRDTCAIIAFYRLHRGRHTDETRQAYEDAIRYLENINAGRVKLDVVGEEPVSSGAQVVSDAVPRTFSRKNKWL